MLKRSAQLFLGIVVVIVVGLLLVRVTYATHKCGSTSNQFTKEGVSTHGCTMPGAKQNPDYRDTNDDQYKNTKSVPAEKGTDGGNKKSADETVKKFDSNKAYVVDEQIHGTTDPQVAAQSPGAVQDIPQKTSDSGGGGTSSGCGDKYDCITYTCTQCGTDGRCQEGIGENPQFSFGGASGACNQVDRRPKGSTKDEWEVVSLCDPSCSGGGYTTPSYPTPGNGKPEKGLECEGLKSSSLKPDIGETLKLTCSAEAKNTNVDHFEFRYKVDEGEFQSLAAGTAQEEGKGFVGMSQLKVTKAGSYEVQCRVCKDTAGKSCTSWGKEK